MLSIFVCLLIASTSSSERCLFASDTQFWTGSLIWGYEPTLLSIRAIELAGRRWPGHYEEIIHQGRKEFRKTVKRCSISHPMKKVIWKSGLRYPKWCEVCFPDETTWSGLTLFMQSSRPISVNEKPCYESH